MRLLLSAEILTKTGEALVNIYYNTNILFVNILYKKGLDVLEKHNIWYFRCGIKLKNN